MGHLCTPVIGIISSSYYCCLYYWYLHILDGQPVTANLLSIQCTCQWQCRVDKENWLSISSWGWLRMFTHTQFQKNVPPYFLFMLSQCKSCPYIHLYVSWVLTFSFEPLLCEQFLSYSLRCSRHLSFTSYLLAYFCEALNNNMSITIYVSQVITVAFYLSLMLPI